MLPRHMTKLLSIYLNEMRIDFSCKLLKDTELSVSQITYESGYYYLPYFNRKFRDLKNDIHMVGYTLSVHMKNIMVSQLRLLLNYRKDKLPELLRRDHRCKIITGNMHLAKRGKAHSGHR